MCAEYSDAWLIDVARVKSFEEVVRPSPIVDMVSILLHDRVFEKELRAAVDIQEDAASRGLGCQLVAGPVLQARMADACNILLSTDLEELRKSPDLLILFVLQRVFDNNIEALE